MLASREVCMALSLTDRNGIFYIRGTVLGRAVRESTKTRKRDWAVRILRRREAEIAEEVIEGSRPKSFNECAESYVECGGSTRFLEPLRRHLGERLLEKLVPVDLDGAAKALYPVAARATLIRQCYIPFIAVWNHAARQHWVEPRSWPKPRKPKGTSVVARTTRRGSVATTYDRAAEFVRWMSPAPAYVMTGLFYTGMRPIELFALDFDAGDINVDGRWIVVRSSKIGEPRGVPMHEFLVPLFSALQKRGGRVFRTYKGEPYPLNDDPDERSGGQMQTAIDAAGRRSGIKDIVPYTARHTVSTQLVLERVDKFTKDDILGHRVTDTSSNYTHIPQAPLIEAINRLPVPERWRDMDWWVDPLWYARKSIAWGKKATEARRLG